MDGRKLLLLALMMGVGCATIKQEKPKEEIVLEDTDYIYRRVCREIKPAPDSIFTGILECSWEPSNGGYNGR